MRDGVGYRGRPAQPIGGSPPGSIGKDRSGRNSRRGQRVPWAGLPPSARQVECIMHNLVLPLVALVVLAVHPARADRPVTASGKVSAVLRLQ